MWYVTERALSEGIIQLTDEEAETDDGGLTLYYDRYHTAIDKEDFFRTLEEAQERVKNLAETKIRSLEKQRAKLEILMAQGAPVRPFSKEDE